VVRGCDGRSGYEVRCGVTYDDAADPLSVRVTIIAITLTDIATTDDIRYWSLYADVCHYYYVEYDTFDADMPPLISRRH